MPWVTMRAARRCRVVPDSSGSALAVRRDLEPALNQRFLREDPRLAARSRDGWTFWIIMMRPAHTRGLQWWSAGGLVLGAEARAIGRTIWQNCKFAATCDLKCLG